MAICNSSIAGRQDRKKGEEEKKGEEGKEKSRNGGRDRVQKPGNEAYHRVGPYGQCRAPLSPRNAGNGNPQQFQDNKLGICCT